MRELIPYSFIRSRLPLSWQDAAWGHEHKYLSWADLPAIAEDRLVDGSSDPLETSLACLGKSDIAEMRELLTKLASRESKFHEGTIVERWLYLVLAWLYETRGSKSDFLGEIECVYADFDYPEEIAGFVRYMPVQGVYRPELHSAQENEARLLSNIEVYLAKSALRLRGEKREAKAG
jgi:hypothetical protein